MMDIEKIGNDIIANDGALNKSEAETVQETVIQAFQNRADARGLLPAKNVPSGAQYASFYITDFDEDEKKGIIQKGQEYPGITVEGDKVQVKLQKLGRSFQIYERDLKAARQSGIPLETSTANAAARAVGQSESYLIMQGAYGVPGLFDSDNTEVASGATSGWDDSDVDFSQVASDLKDAVSEIADDASKLEKTLILPKAEYYWAQFKTNSNDTSYLNLMKQHVDNVEWNSYVPADTALLKVEDRSVAEYAIAEELNLIAAGDWKESKVDAFEYKTRLIATPLIKQRSGMCEITGV